MRKAIASLFAVSLVPLTGVTFGGQQGPADPPCLHGAQETDVDAMRRRSAISALRNINTQEAERNPSGGFVSLDQLKAPELPEGFVLHFAAERSAYAALLIDSRDPCGYALSTSQNGVIFEGAPIRRGR